MYLYEDILLEGKNKKENKKKRRAYEVEHGRSYTNNPNYFDPYHGDIDLTLTARDEFVDNLMKKGVSKEKAEEAFRIHRARKQPSRTTREFKGKKEGPIKGSVTTHVNGEGIITKRYMKQHEDGRTYKTLMPTTHVNTVVSHPDNKKESREWNIKHKAKLDAKKAAEEEKKRAEEEARKKAEEERKKNAETEKIKAEQGKPKSTEKTPSMEGVKLEPIKGVVPPTQEKTKSTEKAPSMEGVKLEPIKGVATSTQGKTKSTEENIKTATEKAPSMEAIKPEPTKEVVPPTPSTNVKRPSEPIESSTNSNLENIKQKNSKLKKGAKAATVALGVTAAAVAAKSLYDKSKYKKFLKNNPNSNISFKEWKKMKNKKQLNESDTLFLEGYYDAQFKVIVEDAEINGFIDDLEIDYYTAFYEEANKIYLEEYFDTLIELGLM